jgi:protein SCO1/2
MKRTKVYTVVFVLLVLTISVRAQDAGSAASTQTATQAAVRDVRIEQKLNDSVPPDLTFQDETGQTVQLRDYFGTKPIILTLVYYQCPMLCTVVLNGLTESLTELRFNIGDEFTVVTVSIDPTETTQLAAEKKALYTRRYGRPSAAAGWHFLTGDEEAIKQLAQAVGFHYVYDPTIKQFAHASGIMILTPQGRIARYFYGIEYPPRDLRLGLVEAAAGKIGSPVDQVLLLCYHYDPATGKYTYAAMNLMRLGGVVTLIGLALFMMAMSRKQRKDTANKGELHHSL